MNFYVIRECPYPAPTPGDVIGYDRAIAESWDIIYIWTTNKKLPAGVLHQRKNGSMVYVDPVDYHTFNMLDAFGIPHTNVDKFTVITPQIIANKDGSRDVTLHKVRDDNKPIPIGQYLKTLRSK